MSAKGWQAELFAQSDFASLYLAARRHVAVGSTTIVVAVVFLISVIPVLLGIYGAWCPITTNDVVSGIRVVTNLGVSFATSILGFLVSGFALFFAITRSDVLVLLAGVPRKRAKISHLQFILFSFMYVFIHYIVYLGGVLGISTLFSPKAILTSTAAFWASRYPSVIKVSATLLFGVSTAWLALILLLLKSFIWNLYQTVLIAITVGADMDSGRLKKLLEALQGDGETD